MTTGVPIGTPVSLFMSSLNTHAPVRHLLTTVSRDGGAVDRGSTPSGQSLSTGENPSGQGREYLLQGIRGVLDQLV
jgi:hypothetical protein